LLLAIGFLFIIGFFLGLVALFVRLFFLFLDLFFSLLLCLLALFIGSLFLILCVFLCSLASHFLQLHLMLGLFFRIFGLDTFSFFLQCFALSLLLFFGDSSHCFFGFSHSLVRHFDLLLVFFLGLLHFSTCQLLGDVNFGLQYHIARTQFILDLLLGSIFPYLIGLEGKSLGTALASSIVGLWLRLLLLGIHLGGGLCSLDLVSRSKFAGIKGRF